MENTDHFVDDVRVTHSQTPTINAAARPVIASARGLTKTYGKGHTAVHALAGVDVDIHHGEFTAIMGPSGSGKSTLMHCLASLDTPTTGTVTINGTDIAKLTDSKLTEFRRDNIGFIFQSFNLIPTLTAERNITLPLDIAGHKPDKQWFDKVIDTVGLRNRLTHRPAELSGGQQQRVACARAMVAKPDIIFADEPTGNLDSSTSADVLGFLKSSVHDFGQTVAMVTHEPSAAAYADRVIFLADGHIASEITQPTAELVLEEVTRLINDPHTQEGTHA